MVRTTLSAIFASALAVFAFISLQRSHFQIIIKNGSDNALEAGSNQQKEDVARAPEQPVQAAPAPEPRAPEQTPTAAQQQPVRRSVQEEYELAARIMETQSTQLRQARAVDNRIQFGGFYFEDQMAFDQWWLDNYERECLPYGRGSINYRHCRANWKDRVMDECRDRKLRYEGLASADRDVVRPINEAQCYAANNYKIVE